MTNSDIPEPSHRPPRRLWKWIKRLAITGFLIAVALSATAYFSRDYLAAKTHEILKAELGKRNIYADYGASKFSMVRGLVFSDVNIFRTDKKIDPLFSLSNIAFAFNPLNIARGTDISAHITSQAGTFTVHHPERPTEFTDFEYSAIASPDTIRIRRLDGRTTGLRLALSGDISTKAPASPGGSKEAEGPSAEEGLGGLDLSPIANVIEFLSVQPQDAPPLFSAHVVRVESGDIRAVGSFSGETFSWRGTPFDLLEVDFATAEDSANSAPDATVSMVRIPSLKLGYGGKSLTASGSYSVRSQVITLTDLRSNIDLLGLISAMRPELGGSLGTVRFAEPPVISAAGTIPTGNPAGADLKGSFSSRSVAIAVDGKKELHLANLTGDFTMAEGTLKSENLSAGVFGGEATAPSRLRPFEKPLQFTTDLTLKNLSVQELANFVGYDPNPGKPQPGTAFFAFAGGGSPSLAGLAGAGRLEVTGAKLIDVPVFRKLMPLLGGIFKGLTAEAGDDSTSATSSFRLDRGVLTSDDIQIKETALAVDGTAWVDFPKQQLKATASVRTKGVTTLITSLAGKALEIEAAGSFDDFGWRFKNVPGLKNLSDLAGGKEGAGGVLTGTVNGAGAAADGVLKAVGDITGVGKDPEGEKDEEGEKKPLGGLRKLLQGKGSE